MSIELRNVTKKVRLGPVRVTYADLDIVIPTGVNVALLGRKQAGLEAITNLICGADAPDKGKVTRTESISWGIPNSSFVSKHISFAANMRFLARLHEADETAYLTRVSELSRAGEMINVTADSCPSDVRTMLCFVAGICLPFDRYIFTNLSVGPKSERGRVTEIVTDLCQRANILIIGQDIKNAQLFCTQAYVFDEGKATFYDDMEAAAEHFGSIEAQEIEDSESLGEDDDLQNLVNVDF